MDNPYLVISISIILCALCDIAKYYAEKTKGKK